MRDSMTKNFQKIEREAAARAQQHYFSLVAGECGGIHRNEWRTVSGPHALVFLEANQPRQSLVDPGINHGFEPDYGSGPGGDRHQKARRAAARGPG